MNVNETLIFQSDIDLAGLKNRLAEIKAVVAKASVAEGQASTFKSLFATIDRGLATISSNSGLPIKEREINKLQIALKMLSSDFSALGLATKNLSNQDVKLEIPTVSIDNAISKLKILQKELTAAKQADIKAISAEMGGSTQKVASGLKASNVTSIADIEQNLPNQISKNTEQLAVIANKRNAAETAVVNTLRDQVAIYGQMQGTKSAQDLTTFAQKTGAYKTELNAIINGEKTLEEVAARVAKSKSSQYQQAEKQMQILEKTIKFEKDLLAAKDRLPASQVAPVQQEIDKTQAFITEETARSAKKYKDELAGVATSAMSSGQAVAGMSTQLKEQTTNMTLAQRASEAFSGGIGDLTRRIAMLASGAVIINQIGKFARETVKVVTELDKTFTEIAMVSGRTRDEAWGLLPQMTEDAIKYGRSITEVAAASTIFYQQGLKTSEVIKMSQGSLTLAAISSISLASATDTLTVALKGYNDVAGNVMSYVDKIAAVGATSGADTAELAQGLSKTAAAANLAGMSFDFTTAALGKMVEVTRKAAESGTGLNTIIARFQSLKDSPLTALDDGTTLNKVTEALASVGVSAVDAKGQFQDLDIVLTDLGSKWDGLDRNTQRYIATVAAGTRQQTNFIALMTDFDRTLELVRASQNSAGAGMSQYAAYSDSVEAAQNRLTASTQSMQEGFLSSNTYKGAIEGLTVLVNIIDRVPPGLLAIGVVAGTVFTKLASVTSKFNVSNLMTGQATSVPTYDKPLASLAQMLDRHKQLSAQSIIQNQATRTQAKLQDLVNDGLIKEATTQALTNALADDSLDITTKQMLRTSQEAILEGQVTAQKQAQVVAQKSIAASQALINIGIGIALIAATAIYSAYQKWADGAAKVAEAEEKANNSRVKSNSLDDSIDQYLELSSIINKTKQEEAEYLTVKNEIISKYPALLAYIDAEGEAHLVTADALKEQAKAQRELARTDEATANRVKLTELAKGTITAPSDFSAATANALGAESSRDARLPNVLPFYKEGDAVNAQQAVENVDRAVRDLENSLENLSRLDYLQSLRELNQLTYEQTQELTRLESAGGTALVASQDGGVLAKPEEIQASITALTEYRKRYEEILNMQAQEVKNLVLPVYTIDVSNIIESTEDAGTEVSNAAKDMLLSTLPDAFISAAIEKTKATGKLGAKELAKQLQEDEEALKQFTRKAIKDYQDEMGALEATAKAADITNASVGERKAEADRLIGEAKAGGMSTVDLDIYGRMTLKQLDIVNYEQAISDFVSSLGTDVTQAAKDKFLGIAEELNVASANAFLQGIGGMKDASAKAKTIDIFNSLFSDQQTKDSINTFFEDVAIATEDGYNQATAAIIGIMQAKQYSPEDIAIFTAALPLPTEEGVETAMNAVTQKAIASIQSMQKIVSENMSGGLGAEQVGKMLEADPSMINKMALDVDGNMRLTAAGIQALADAESQNFTMAMQNMSTLAAKRAEDAALEIERQQQIIAEQQKARDNAINSEGSTSAQLQIDQAMLIIDAQRAIQAESANTATAANQMEEAFARAGVTMAQAVGSDIIAQLDTLAGSLSIMTEASAQMESYGQISWETYQSLIAANAEYADAVYVNANNELALDTEKANAIMDNQSEVTANAFRMRIIEEKAIVAALETQIGVEKAKVAAAGAALASIGKDTATTAGALQTLYKLNGMNFATIEEGKVTVSDQAKSDILKGEGLLVSGLTDMDAKGYNKMTQNSSSWVTATTSNFKKIADEYNKLVSAMASGGQANLSVQSGTTTALSGLGNIAPEAIKTLSDSYQALVDSGEDIGAEAAAAMDKQTAAMAAQQLNQAAQNVALYEAAAGEHRKTIQVYEAAAASAANREKLATKGLSGGLEKGGAKKATGGSGSKEKEKAAKEIKEITSLLEKQKGIVEDNAKAWETFDDALKKISGSFSAFFERFQETKMAFEEFYNYNRKLDSLSNQKDLIEGYLVNPLLSGEKYVRGFKAAIGNVIATGAISADYVKNLRASLDKQAAALVEKYGAYYQFDSSGQIYQDYQQLNTEVPAVINEQKKKVFDNKELINEKKNQIEIAKAKEKGLQAQNKLYDDYYKTYKKNYEDAEKNVKSARESLAKAEEDAAKDKTTVDPKSKAAAEKTIAENVKLMDEWQKKMNQYKGSAASSNTAWDEQAKAVAALQNELELLGYEQKKEEMILSDLESYVSDMSSAVKEYEQTYADLQTQIKKAQDQMKELVSYRETAFSTARSIEDQLFNAILEGYDKELQALQKVHQEKENLDQKRLKAVRDNIDAERRLRSRANQEDEIAQKQKRLNLLQRDTSGAYSGDIGKLRQEIEALRQTNRDQIVDDEYEKLQREVDARAELFKLEQEAMIEQINYYKENSKLIWDEVNVIMLQGADAVQSMLETSSQYLNASALQQQRYQEEWSQQIALALEVTVDKMLVELDKMILEYQDILDIQFPEIEQALSEHSSVYSAATQDLSASMSMYSSQFNQLVQEMADTVGSGIYAARDLIVKAAQQLYDDVVAKKKTFETTIENDMQVIRDDTISEGAWAQEISDIPAKSIKVKTTAKTKKYNLGGLNDYTGWAMMHGTPTNPEYVLNSAQTDGFLRLVDAITKVPSIAQNDSSQSIQINTLILQGVSDSNLDQGEEFAKQFMAKVQKSSRGKITQTV